LNTTWALVCDASRARILVPNGRGESWRVLETLDHPASRQRASDLVSDQQGRVQQSGNAASRPGMAPRTDPTDVEAEHFARELSNKLQHAFDQQTFDRLIVAAPPRFLGVLRGIVSKPVQRAVIASIDKDYTHADPDEIEKRLRPHIDKAHKVE
jgi:protein required for attachment to host cells